MALTIAIEGKGVIANCDALTDDTGGTGTGDWGEIGGGTISLNPDVYIYGNNSIGSKYASKSGNTYFNLGTGNELDFLSGGTEEGEFIYIWINISAGGALDTLTNNGLAIRIGSSTTDYIDFTIAGNDDTNGWTGGWKLFVLDPTLTPTLTTGTIDLSSIIFLGLWIDTSSSVRADSIWIDQIAVGKGLRITGTSTTGWKEVVDYCTDYTNRAWGMFQEIEGIYFTYGKIYIGDSTQTANTSFVDSGRVIQFGTSEFWSGSAWVRSFPISGEGIVIEDTASFTTIFQDGIIVGTDSGRAGTQFIGNSLFDISMDLYGGNNANSVTTLYGTSLKNITGVINSGNDAQHKFLSVSMAGCSQFDPVGAPVIRNCTFAETDDVDSALLWNENINIADSIFIANTLGAAIEQPSSAGTPYAYDNLQFSGNTFDVLNSSGSAIEINKNNGSNPSTSEGSSVTFLGVSVTTQITVRDIDTGLYLENARVLVWVSDGTNFPYLASVTITGTGTTATVTHTAHGLSTGDNVIIEGVDQEVYHGAYSITVTDVNTYTYTTVETISVTPATGTIVSTFALISGLTNVSGIISDTRSLGADQPIAGRVRSASGSIKYKGSPISDTVSSTTGKSINVQLIPDQ